MHTTIYEIVYTIYLLESRDILVVCLRMSSYRLHLSAIAAPILGSTVQLLKVNNLRNSQNRSMFNHSIEIGKAAAQKRLWTESLLRDSLFTLLQKRQLFIPVTHDFTIESWVKEQAQKLHKLARKAAKNQWQLKRGRSKSAMDNVETQAWLEDCVSQLSIHSIPTEISLEKITCCRD